MIKDRVIFNVGRVIKLALKSRRLLGWFFKFITVVLKFLNNHT